ncbi:hypothetical protein GCM10027051_31130 [Niabella terrae]
MTDVIRYSPVLKLKDMDFKEAAALLGCDEASVRAVADVESSGDGFLIWKGKTVPKILFERHYFSRLTSGKYDKSHPTISNPVAGGYGTYSIQHDKLSEAVALDREAALQSCSFGMFQIMGANFKQAGYPDIQSFVNAMYNGVNDHLRAFCNFIKNDSRLLNAIRNKDWASFARYYNGPAYKKNNYDNKLKTAYQKYSK